jgi:hypothetical protein
MKKIFIRSPYFIEIDEAGQIGSKIELYFYNKGTSIPSEPTYSLSKPIASTLQTKHIYNISNYAKDFIKPIAPVNVIVPTEENVNTWCYVLVKRYKEVSSGSYTLIDEETIVCLNGYNQYSDGYNYSSTDDVIPLVNVDIKRQNDSYISCWIDDNVLVGSVTWVWGLLGEFDIDSVGTIWKLPLAYSRDNYLIGESTIFRITAEEICEPKYTPITCSFINRYGGWEYLTFFKANTQSIDVKSKDFDMLPSALNYNVLQGQKRVFNKQGNQKIKCNTGWVYENYSELIQDLLLSEIVLLDDEPVVVKSQSFDIKTSLKDKNINYEIEFEYSFGLINDVI